MGFFNVNVCNRTLQLVCCLQLTACISVKYNEYKWKGSYFLDASQWPNTRTKYFEPSKAHPYRREKHLLASSCLSVRPSIHLSDYISTAPNGWSYLKFDISKVCGNPHPNMTKIGYLKRRPN